MIFKDKICHFFKQKMAGIVYNRSHKIRFLEEAMQTILLQNKVRESSSGKTWTIEVIGDSACKETVKQAISELEHYPAKAARRSLIDLLSIIEANGFQIQYTEHDDGESAETWSFLLQR